MADSPLVILLVKWLLKFIGYLCAIVALPFTLYSLLVKAILGLNDNFDSSAGFYAVMWIPRWIILSLFLPFFALESFAIGYGLSQSMTIGISIGIAIAFAVANLIGFLFTRFDSVLGEMVPKLAFVGKDGYFRGFFKAQLDLIAFLCLIFVIVGIVRIPFFLSFLLSGKEKIRSQIFIEFVMTFVDLFTLPFLLFNFVFFWRLPTTYRRITKKTRWQMKELGESFAARGTIIAQFWNALLDIPVFLLGIFFLLTPWRIPVVAVKVYAKNTLNKKRKSWLKQLGLMFLDLSCLIFGIFVVATVYRSVAMFMNFHAQTTAKHRRIVVCRQFAFVLVDIFTIFASLFVIVFVYRIPCTVTKSRHHDRNWGFFPQPNRRHARASIQHVIIKQFGRILLDLPFLLMGGIVTVLLWRALFLWKDLKVGDTTVNAAKRRITALKHFGLLFLDVIDLPFVLASIIITITLWRAVPFWKGITETGKTRNKRRLFVLTQFGKWLLDIPTLLAFFILMVTIYRAKDTIDGLKKVWFGSSAGASSVPSPGMELEDNPAPPSSEGVTWHMVVGRQFGSLLLDIPFPILVALTLWRMPWCIKRVIKECDNAFERRMMILRFLWSTLKDIPCVVLFLFIVLTLWRIPSLYHLYKSYNRGDNEHKLLLGLFGKTLADIHYICFWRGFFLIKYIVTSKDNTDKDNRSLAGQYFLAVIGDICVVLMGAIILGTVWRIQTCIFLVKYMIQPRQSDPDFRWRHLTGVLAGEFRTVLLIFADIISIAQMVVVVVGIFHIPTSFKRFYRATKLFSNGGDGSKVRAFATYANDYNQCMTNSRRELEDGGPLSLSFYRPIVYLEFLDTLRHLPHLFLLPLKAAGVVFLPIHLYLSYRIDQQARKDMQMYVTDFAVYGLDSRSIPPAEVSGPYPARNNQPRKVPLSSPSTASSGAPISPSSSSSPFINSSPNTKRANYGTSASNNKQQIDTSASYSGSSASESDEEELVNNRKNKNNNDSNEEIGKAKEKEIDSNYHELTTSPSAQTMDTHHSDSSASDEIIAEKEDIKEKEVIEDKENNEIEIENDNEKEEGAEKDTTNSEIEINKEKREEDDIGVMVDEIEAVYANNELNNQNNNQNNEIMNEIYEDEIINNEMNDANNANNTNNTINTNYDAETAKFYQEYYGRQLDATQPLKEYKMKKTENVSFLQYPLLWLHAVAAPRMNFWGMDQFFILNCVSLFVVVPNEIAMVLLLFNLAFIFFLTLGSPLWNNFRRKHNWTELGTAQGYLFPLEILLLATQALYFPVFVFAQLFMLFIPIFIISASYFPEPDRWPSFTKFFHDFFTTSSYWHRFSDFPWWFWILQVYWTLIIVVSLHLTLIYAKKVMPLFNPVMAYYWLVKRVFAGRMWGFYQKLLVIPTKFCYRHRHSCKVGEFLMFPLFISWVGWPMVIPPFTSYYVFIPSGIITCFLIFKGYFLVKANWGADEVPAIEPEALTLNSVRVETPPTGGLIFIIEGIKDVPFTITQAKWRFEGAELWKTLGTIFGGAAISTVKMTVHPIDLIPQLMDVKDLAAGKREFVMTIRAGVAGSGRVLKHSTLTKKLNLIVKNGDPQFRMVFEHGRNKLGWKKAGILCAFDLRISDILRAAASGESLVQPGREPPAFYQPAIIRNDIQPDFHQPIIVHNIQPQRRAPATSQPPPPPPPPFSQHHTNYNTNNRTQNIPNTQQNRQNTQQQQQQQRERESGIALNDPRVIAVVSVTGQEASVVRDVLAMFDGDADRAANHLLQL